MPKKIKNDLDDGGLINEEEIEVWFASEEEEAGEEIDETTLRDDLIEEKFAKSQIRIVRQTMDLSLHNLRQALLDNTYINLSPFYQRRNRWDLKKRSQLIESFLMNIPVPPIFLFENKYNQYEVMDGRQRLETIRDYLNGTFSLTGLDVWTELNKRNFNQLPELVQSGLLRRTLPAIVLLAETTNPSEFQIDVRMVLFRRLNTGGVQLNPQELRNALYPGEFNNMLRETARMEPFTTIWGIPAKTEVEDTDPPKELINNALYKTMADCELVLRYFAIRETIEQGLRGSLKKLLDSCMVRHQHDTPSEAGYYSQEFVALINTLYETFNGKPFLLPTNKPSHALYDALMVALSRNPDLEPIQNKVKIASRLEARLRNGDSYDILVGRGNSIEAIKNRVNLAEKILRG